MKKRLWKWLRNVLDSTATWIDVVERWFEGAALWIEVNKCAPRRLIPPERMDTLLPPSEWRPVPTCFTVPPNWDEFVEVTVEEASRIANIQAYYRVESTDIPGLERSPYAKPSEGDEPCPPSK